MPQTSYISLQRTPQRGQKGTDEFNVASMTLTLTQTTKAVSYVYMRTRGSYATTNADAASLSPSYHEATRGRGAELEAASIYISNMQICKAS
jgi:hypothetical protein